MDRFALFLLFLIPAFSQAPAPSPSTTPEAKEEDPLDRVTPRSSVLSFLNAVRGRHDDTAAQFLQLDKIPAADRAKLGPQLARRLGSALDRDAHFDVGSLSKDPEGNRVDGLPPDRERVGNFQIGTTPLELERLKPPGENEPSIWVFSSDSVAMISKLDQGLESSIVEKHLPVPLVQWTLLGTALWRLILLSVLVAVAWALSRTLSQFVLFVARPIGARLAPGMDLKALEAILDPLRVLVTVAIVRAGIAIITPSALARFYLSRILALVTILGFAWLMADIMDLIILRVSHALKTKHATLSRSVLPLVSRIFKAIVLVLAITAILANWGFDMTAILAGVGIGGIAVALAAQKTIENLFGGVALITDSPVIVGDFCKFGDRVGTVEDIGLRSTSIRTPDRTVVTIPNSEFSSMILENFSRRDKIAFHPHLNLRRDTSADQMHQIIRAIRSILQKNPKVETGVIPVRFIGTGAYSLDVEISAYILTNNSDEYLRIQEDLLLEIMGALDAAGAGLALPTQASVNYDDRLRIPEPVAH